MFFAPTKGKQKAMDKRFVIYLGLSLLLMGCHKKPKADQTPLLTVTTIEAVAAEISPKREFIGYLQSNFDAVIQPRVNGFLTSKRFSNGMPVKQGALLYTIDKSQFSASMLAAEASLQSARAKAVEARNNYERAVPLAEMNAISRAQLDQYTATFKASEAAVKSAEQTLKNARLDLSYTDIRSPIDGIAGGSNAHIGDYVGPGTEFSVLTTISNTDTLSFDVSLPMAEYLRLGGSRERIYENDSLLSNISLMLDDGSRYPLAGFYSHTRKDVAAATGTIILVVKFANPESQLKPGQFGRVQCRIGRPEQAVMVPQRAVSEAQGISSVWVIRNDSTAQFREVETGPLHDSLWVITRGLEAGEKVALTGRQKLETGQRVNPINQ